MVGAHQAGRDRKSRAESLTAGDEVGEVAAAPKRARSSEPRVDLVRDEERARLVAAFAEPLEETGGRDARPRPALDGLDNDAPRVERERAGILPERPAMHGAGKPRREGTPEVLEAARREREQPRAVVGARERDDARATGDEKRGPQGDLDRVLPGHAEHDLTVVARQASPQLGGDVGLGQIAQGVHAARSLLGDRRLDLRVSVAESRDPESAREVDVPAPLRVDDTAPLGLRPDHGRSLFRVSIAT